MTVASANQVSPTLEQLNERVRTLEDRVAALEGKSQKAPNVVLAPAPRAAKPPETWQGFPSIQLPGMVTTLGKAVLGIAGAYLLRAFAESGAIPKLPVLILAIAYAGLWTYMAVRVREDQFATVAYAFTSALILSPMLWESTVRFQFLSPSGTGTVLAGYVLVTMALVWRRDLDVVLWIATLSASVTALALLITTHALVPLTVSLLAIAVVVEMAACYGRFLAMRAVSALAADVSVALLLFVMTSSSGVPEGYQPVPVATLVAIWFTLASVYVGSIGIRSFWMLQRVTLIDIGQGALAFAIAGFGATRTGHPFVSLGFGVYLLILAAGCYWGVLSRFTEAQLARNRRVAEFWAVALMTGGSLLLFPAFIRELFLCSAGIAATLLYTRSQRIGVGLQASVLLAAAAAVSTLPKYAIEALTGTVPSEFNWIVLTIGVAGALCYLIGSGRQEVRKGRRALWIFPAALAVFAGAALSAVGMTWFLAGSADISASKVSVVRTVILCVFALGLGVVGIRTCRVELRWLAYVVVAAGTLKLVMEDLRFGNAASLVVSLLVYGLILIALPRLSLRRSAEQS